MRDLQAAADDHAGDLGERGTGIRRIAKAELSPDDGAAAFAGGRLGERAGRERRHWGWHLDNAAHRVAASLYLWLAQIGRPALGRMPRLRRTLASLATIIGYAAAQLCRRRQAPRGVRSVQRSAQHDRVVGAPGRRRHRQAEQHRQHRHGRRLARVRAHHGAPERALPARGCALVSSLPVGGLGLVRSL